jgi:hypothetical protein
MVTTPPSIFEVLMSEKKTDFTRAVLLSLPPGSRYTIIEDSPQLIVDPLASAPTTAQCLEAKARLQKAKRGYKKPTPWPSKK